MFLGYNSWTAEGLSGFGNFADRQVPIRVRAEGAISRIAHTISWHATPILHYLGMVACPRDVKRSPMEDYLGAGFSSGPIERATRTPDDMR